MFEIVNVFPADKLSLYVIHATVLILDIAYNPNMINNTE